MKPVYFNVLSRLSTEVTTKKHPNFVLLAFFFLAKIDFQSLLGTLKSIKGGMKTVHF